MSIDRAAPPPVFVVGPERSGTTMLRLMLTSHPAICIPPESAFAVVLGRKFGQADDLTPHLDDIVDALMAQVHFAEWGLSREQVREALDDLPAPVRWRSVVESIYALYVQLRKPDATHWGDKNPCYSYMLHEVRALFPDSLILQIVRDPRGCWASLLDVRERCDGEWRGSRNGLIVEGFIWRNIVRNRLRHTGDPRFHLIRYEDLVREPESVLRRVCSFIGVEFDPAMLAFHENNAREGLLAERTHGIHRLTFGPPQADRAEAWRARLKIGDVQALGILLESDLKASGYKPLTGWMPLAGFVRLMRAALWEEIGPLAGIVVGAVKRRVGLG